MGTYNPSASDSWNISILDYMGIIQLTILGWTGKVSTYLSIWGLGKLGKQDFDLNTEEAEIISEMPESVEEEIRPKSIKKGYIILRKFWRKIPKKRKKILRTELEITNRNHKKTKSQDRTRQVITEMCNDVEIHHDDKKNQDR